jgi:outer membrane lipoprotein-sorting protein
MSIGAGRYRVVLANGRVVAHRRPRAQGLAEGLYPRATFAAKLKRKPGSGSSERRSTVRYEDNGGLDVNILRRLPLSRLLLLCAAVVALGASLAAIAIAASSGPTPPPKPLAQAIHDALAAAPPDGVQARIKFSDRLFEGAELASGGEGSPLSSSPLISGASGRLWIAKDGRARLELQADRGDTQVIYDGKKIELYDAASNTLYEYAIPQHTADTAKTANGRTPYAPLPEANGCRRSHAGGATRTTLCFKAAGKAHADEPPSIAKIEESLSHASEHANLSGAMPTDVAGQAAYTLRVSPKETGSLIGGAELSWDAVHGVPLRAAVYSTKNSTAVLELAATDISYGPVDPSVFDFTPPPGTTVKQLGGSSGGGSSPRAGSSHTKLRTHGRGVTSIAVIESHTSANGRENGSVLPSSLPKVKIGATSATELATALGTVLSFERNGVRYVLLGALPPAPLEELARGL